MRDQASQATREQTDVVSVREREVVVSVSVLGSVSVLSDGCQCALCSGVSRYRKTRRSQLIDWPRVAGRLPIIKSSISDTIFYFKSSASKDQSGAALSAMT